MNDQPQDRPDRPEGGSNPSPWSQPSGQRPGEPTGPGSGGPQQPYGAGQQPYGNGPQPYGSGQPSYGAGPGQQPYGSGPSQGGPGRPGQPYPGGPQQPGPQQPGPYQQPHPGQPQQPGYGGPGFPAGSGASGGGSNGRKVGLVIAVAALAVILIAGGLIAVVATRGGGPEASGPGDPSETPVAQAPEQVVQAYLEAIAGGRAEEALGYLYDKPYGDASLLTDEVLAVSNEIAPITAISVTPPADPTYGGDVTATYLVGEEQASYEFSVIGRAEDGYKISTGTVSGSLSGGDGIEVLVNGVAPSDPDSIALFPGGYQVTTEQKYFTVDDAEYVLTDPRADGYLDVEVTLDKDGTAAFTKLVTESAEKCVASKKREAGCGLDLPATLSDGTKVAENSIKRSMPAETRKRLKELEPQLGSSDPTLVRAKDYLGSVKAEAGCTKGSQKGTCEILGAPGFGSPTVDFAAKELTVEWD